MLVFATDDVSVISFNECLLAARRNPDASTSADASTTGHVFLVNVHGEKNAEVQRVVLKVKYDSDRKHHIEDSHILLHKWVLDMLGLNNGDDIELRPVDLAPVESGVVRSVSLHFTAAMSLLNYDEFYLTSDCFHSNGEMNLPCTWQTVWPGLSEAALVGLMSTLLHGACLVNLGLVCVSFLEHDVIFRTILNYADKKDCDNEHCFLVESFDAKFDIVVAPEDVLENEAAFASASAEREVAEEEEKSPIIPFVQSTFQRLSKVLLLSLSPPPAVAGWLAHADRDSTRDSDAIPHGEGAAAARGEWLGPHSALLMSSPGSGKTHLLRGLVEEVRRKLTAPPLTSSSLFVFVLSGDFSSQALTSSVDEESQPASTPPLQVQGSAASSPPSSQAQELLRVLHLLVQALPPAPLLEARQRGQSGHDSQLQSISAILAETGQLPPICVVIDDADSMLATTEEATSSSSSSSRERSSESRRASLLLRRLLAAITTPACCLPLCVLASTSFSLQADVAPVFRSPPGFEVTVTLPLPSFVDRCLLLKSFLDEFCGRDLEGLLGELPTGFVVLGREDDAAYNGDACAGDCGDEGFDSCEDDEEWSSRRCGGSRHVFAWVSRAASLTAGYLPADLRKIVTRALNLASARTSHKTAEPCTTSPQSSPLRAPQEKGMSAVASSSSTERGSFLLWTDFLTALTATTPAQLLSVTMSEGGGGGGIVVESRDSGLSWSNFAGYAREKATISQILERSNPLYGQRQQRRRTSRGGKRGVSDLARAVGHHAPKGLILHGPSGCGKSHMARIIAAECKMNFITVKSTALLSKFFGETEATLRRLFQKARDAAPCVLFFDEFDAIAHNRSEDGDGETSVMARVLSTFLNELDGISTLDASSGQESEFNVFVLAASEGLDNLDQALLRPGRLSHHVRLGLPSREDVGDLLRFFCSRLPLGEDVCLDEVVRLCTDRLRSSHSKEKANGGPTCAAVSALCREAVQVALRERIIHNPPAPGSHSRRSALDLSNYSLNDAVDGRMRQAHFLKAIDSFLPITIEEEPATFLSQQPPFQINSSVNDAAAPAKASTAEFKFDGSFSIGSR